MEENNVEVMETEVITDVEDVKDDSTMAKVVGTGVGLAALYGVARLAVDGYKAVTTKVIPKAKSWFESKRNKSSEKDSEHEASEEKAETKAEAKESKKDKSKK